MRYLLAFLACLGLLLAACDSDDSDDPDPTTTSAPEATATAPAISPTTSIPVVTPTAEASTPPPIDAENFADLVTVASATVENAERMEWQASGELLVASRREAVRISPRSDAPAPVYKATDSEAIVAISSQGQVATTADRQSIDVRDLTGAIIATIDIGTQFGSVDFSPDGRLLAAARMDKIAVDVWDIEAGALREQLTGFQTAAPVYSASFGPDSETIVWLSRATAELMDIESGELYPALQHEDFLSSLALTDDASLLVTTWGPFATLWQPRDGTRIEDLDQAASAMQAAFVPNSGLLLVGTDEGVRLWDSASFVEIATLPGEARQIAVSADGRYLATVDQNGAITIWAAPS